MRIAFLEDDQDQAQVISLWLEDAGHNVAHFENAKSFIADVRRNSYDVLMLDWMLPESNGVEVLRWVRENIDWQIPVIFSTQQDEESHIVEALEAGADDYMIKPVKRAELVARMNALGRRAGLMNQKDPVQNFGAFVIDTEKQLIYLNGSALELTNKEYELALFLFKNAGKVVSRGHILESVWGSSPDLNTRKIDTHISRIRTKLSIQPENGWKIAAVYQHGYRLEKVEIAEA